MKLFTLLTLWSFVLIFLPHKSEAQVEAILGYAPPCPKLARGNVVGNGGDSIAREFAQAGDFILNSFTVEDFKTLPFTKSDFIQALKRTSITTADTIDMGGIEVDAENHYPGCPWIEVSRSRWTEKRTCANSRYGIVFHEYLKAVRVDDSNYVVSKKYFPCTENSQ